MYPGLDKAKPRDTPGGKDVGRGVATANDRLNQTSSTMYRSGAGTAPYHSEDVYPVKFAVKEILRSMSSPTVRSELQLRAFIKWMIGNKVTVIFFFYQPLPKDLDVEGDSDCAGEQFPSRKSTSGR